MVNKQPAPQIALNMLNQLTEIILRAGVVDTTPTSIKHLIAKALIKAFIIVDNPFKP